MGKRLRAILTQLRSRFRDIYGDRLVEMILYGSQARRDAEHGSDIDVLVVLAGDVSPCDELERTSDIIYDISFSNDVVVTCVFVSEERFSLGEGPLIRNVRREGVTV